ncbi:MAG: hypothetical protein ABID64_02320 [Nitrospirota bacterium]
MKDNSNADGGFWGEPGCSGGFLETGLNVLTGLIGPNEELGDRFSTTWTESFLPEGLRVETHWVFVALGAGFYSFFVFRIGSPPALLAVSVTLSTVIVAVLAVMLVGHDRCVPFLSVLSVASPTLNFYL